MKKLDVSIMIGIIFSLLLLSIVYVTCYAYSLDRSILAKDQQISTIDKSLVSLKEDIAKDQQKMEIEFLKATQRYIALKRYINKRYTKVPKEVAEIIAITTDRLCKKHNIQFELMIGMLEVESMFNPMAHSNKDARGLLQVRPSVWAKTLNIEDPDELFDIELGIDAGIQVLKHYIKQYNGDITKALQAYNGDKNGTKYSVEVYSAVGRFIVYRHNYLQK